ncbi:MAG TPA: hypothetical protein VKA15_01310 [Isosphaeraceae bacterium]|nr:hypothetical protein [Isosphaeraceae bacterium]
MGIFFRSMEPAVERAIAEALAAPPDTIANLQHEAGTRADQVIQQASGAIIWVRLAVAIVLLIAIFVAGIMTSLYKIDNWSTVLLHSFELILGLVIGLLGGEASARR